MTTINPLGRWLKRRQAKDEARVLGAFTPLRPGWFYGLYLMDQSGLRSGRFYPAVDRLELAGFVEAKWTVNENPPWRRLYRLAQRKEASNPMRIILDFDFQTTDRDPKEVVPMALREMADGYAKTIESGDEGDSLYEQGMNTVGDWYIQPE